MMMKEREMMFEIYVFGVLVSMALIAGFSVKGI
jgi:hypothetical protein